MVVGSRRRCHRDHTGGQKTGEGNDRHPHRLLLPVPAVDAGHPADLYLSLFCHGAVYRVVPGLCLQDSE
ncbi:hypothetical protein D3C75_1235580 [compost metagenome]